jgi:hypothetical protein
MRIGNLKSEISEFAELPQVAKSVWRHYYKKLKKLGVHEFGRFAEALAAVRKAKKDIGSGVRLTRYNDLGVSKQVASYSIDKTRPTVWRITGAGKKIPTTSPQGRINVPKPKSKPLFSYLHEAGHAKLHHGTRKGFGDWSALNVSGRTDAPSHWRTVLGQERAANKAAVKWAGPLKKEYRKQMRPAFNTYRKAAMAEMYGTGAPGTTLTHVKSVMKRHPWLRGYGFARIDRGVVEMNRRENLAKQRRLDPIGREAGIPLTGQIAHDRYVIENRQKDIAKRDSNILRAGVAGAAAGAVFGRGRLPLKARLAAGALAGAGSVIGVRAVTHKKGRDVYGARQPWAARTEAAPAVIGAGAAGYGAYRILRKKFLKMSDARFEFAKKEKRQMNPYIMAGLSGAASGAALGLVPLLRRGVGLKTALRTAAGGAAAGGAIVGGGSLLGSGILGNPDEKEGAAFTKRAAVGGALVGGTLGVAGGLVARRVPVVRKQVKKLAKEWRPAHWIEKSGSLKAAGIGGVAGGAYGLGQGADEGQQVDSIRNIRKDLKRVHGFAAQDWRDARRESRSAAAKDYLTGAAAMTAGAGVGGGVGYAGWRAGKAANEAGAAAADVRKTTRGARAATARITRSSQWIKRQLTTFPTFRKLRGMRVFSQEGDIMEFEKPFHGYSKKRHAKTGGLNDSFRQKYNREHGSNLKRPVTKDPSKLKPGSKAAKRRASFCARMGGMPGPTSKDGKLTPKGAALKRWNCEANGELIEFNQRKKESGALDGTGRAASALGIGVAANTVAGVAGLLSMASDRRAIGSNKRILYSKKGGAPVWQNPATKSSETLDRFATRKGYKLVDADFAGVGHGDKLFYRHRDEGAAIRAHEAGHVAQRDTRNRAYRKVINSPTGRKIYSPAAIVGSLAGAVGTDPSNDKRATAIAAAATAATLPTMASEIDASVRGYKMMRRMGESRARSLGTFKGLPTYASLAAIPAIAWGLRKRSQAKQQKKAELADARNSVEFAEGGDFKKILRPLKIHDPMIHPRQLPHTPQQTKDMLEELRVKYHNKNKWRKRMEAVARFLDARVAAVELQQMAPMAPMNPMYDERERLKRNLMVTGAVAAPVGGVTYAGWRSLRKSADSMRLEEDRMKLGQRLREERKASMAVGGKVNNKQFGPRGPIARKPLRVNPSMQPETVERNVATNKAIAVGKRYESEIKNVKVHSRGERKAMRAALAALRTKYKFSRKGGVHSFEIYARSADTGRAAGFYDYVQGKRLTRKNPMTGQVEDVTVTLPAFIHSAQRQAEKYNRTRKRSMALVRDVSEVSQGKKTKKREWEKGWFQNKLQTAAGAAALLGAGVVYRKGGYRSAPGWAKSFRSGADKAIGKAQTYRAKAEDRLGKIMGLSARLKNSVRMLEGGYYDYYSAPGWDLRDARGNSARVFSPKAKKRNRRTAEWYEKKDGERKLLIGAGLLGTAAAATGGVLIGRRFPVRKAARITKKENVIAGPWKKKA